MAVHVVHIGDLHLGPNDRQADRLAALDAAIAIGEQSEQLLGLWVVPGDLFHRNSTIDDRNAIAPRLQRMAAVAPVVIAPGNHDAPGDLDILGRLQATFPIVVMHRPEVVRLQLATGDHASIAAIPYPSRAGLVAAGIDSALVEQTGSHGLELLVAGLGDQLTQAMAAGDMPIVVGHINVAGALASSGQPQIGREIELAPTVLAHFPSGAYVGLNHIHKHQQVGRGVYAGSMCRLDYGEIEPKGFVLVTYKRLTASAWAHAWRFVELPVAPMYHVEGDLTRDGFVFVCTAGVGGEIVPTPATWQGCEVRVRYSFIKAEIGALDVAHIHATFAGCKSIKLDPVPTLAQNVRAPEIATAQTLEAKVQTCCGLQGVQWTPSLAHKLAALQTQDSAAVLADVIASPLLSREDSRANAATLQQPELDEVRA